MEINPSEVTKILKEQIKNFGEKAEVSEVGQVLSVGDGIARIYGLNNVQAGEMVEFSDGSKGMALNLESDNVGVVIFGDDRAVKEIRDFFEANPQAQLPAAQARQMLINDLYLRNGVDEAFQNAIDKDNEDKTKSNDTKPRVTKDNALRAILNAQADGTLTPELVNSYFNDLSQSDFKTFMNAAFAEVTRQEEANSGKQTAEEKLVDEYFDSSLKLARSKYQYDALSTDDSSFATSSRAAYFKVHEKLYRMLLDSKKNGAEPLTVAKIEETLQAGFKENEQLYFDDVRANFDSYVMTNQSATTITGKGHVFTRSPNMVKELEDWWKTLTPTERANGFLLAEYNRVMSRLRMFMKSGAYGEPTQ